MRLLPQQKTWTERGCERNFTWGADGQASCPYKHMYKLQLSTGADGWAGRKRPTLASPLLGVILHRKENKWVHTHLPTHNKPWNTALPVGSNPGGSCSAWNFTLACLQSFKRGTLVLPSPLLLISANPTEPHKPSFKTATLEVE